MNGRWNGVTLACLLFQGSALAADTSSSLTLMTYNLHIGVPMGHEIGRYAVGEKEMRAFANVITSAAPDIIAMQEVDCEYGYTLTPDRRRSGMINMPRRLSSLTGLWYAFGSAQDDIRYPSDNAEYIEWGTAEQWTNNGARHGEVGNALMVRGAPIDKPVNLALPRLAGKERRACLRVETSIAVLYATHLQHDSGESRLEQMAEILQSAKAETSDSLVFIMGDLNDVAPPSGDGDGEVVKLAIDKGFFDLHREFAKTTGVPPQATFPADHPKERIDYILCNRKLDVIKVEVPSTFASDHLPLILTVKLPR